MPGFGIALGFTLFYLGLLVLIPLGALVLKTAGLGWAGFWKIAMDPRVLAALKLSFGGSFAAALINVAFGLPVAWALVRYRFPGRKVFDAFVDLPFALPTAVAGISLAALYAPNGWIGGLLAPLGLKIAYTPVGVIVALTFVGLPFIVRTLEPVLEDLDREPEEAAATLGATRRQTFVSVIFPTIVPALLTGFALSLARAVGEYGSVIFIAGNIPFVSEIAPLLIVIRLQEFNYAGATAVGTIMLVISFALLLLVNLIQTWARRKYGAI
jgi:sulfate transport system permease protein